MIELRGGGAERGHEDDGVENRAGQQAVKVGVAAWLGIMAGLLAKLVIACVMIGLFAVALLL